MHEHCCPWWLGYAIDNPLRRLLHDPEKILAPFVAEGMRVLDVGCGMGLFSLAAARLVGARGKVVSADIQQKMLDAVVRRARAAGLADRVTPHLARPGDLGVRERVDFALAFWMVHETPDPAAFLRQIRSCLGRGGKLLVAEPKLHVGGPVFEETLAKARAEGFAVRPGPKVRMSRSALLENQAG